MPWEIGINRDLHHSFFDAEAGLDAAEAQDDSDSEGELTEDEDN